jgi:DNA-directed RNA polymerase subunit M/transcription elongation factor TFIIS
MSTYQVLILTQKAEVKTGKINIEENSTVKLENIQKYFKKKTEPELLGTYNYKQLTLFLFGFPKGKAGTENKHELPPPHDSILVFGDIMLIASKSEISFGIPVPFKVEDYEIFYSKAFGGFDDLDEDDDNDDEEEENLENEEEEEVIEDDEEVIDKSSYASYEDIEEEVVIKKEKKKKVNASVNNSTNNIVIHPDLQLKETSEYSELRTKTLANIKTLLKELDKQEITDLENEIYKMTLKEADIKFITKIWTNNPFTELYKCNVRKIIGNLSQVTYVHNNELMKRYKAKEITFEDICKMDYYTLFYSKWREHIIHQQNIEKRQLEGNKSMATDQFLCSRCHKRECTYYEMQTRSADEPMTIFINCLNCGKKWRQ